MLMSVLTFTFVGTLLIAVALPMLLRRLKPNAWYGLRVPATMEDEWVWYEANAGSGRDLIVLGAAQIALAVTLALVPGVTEIVHAGTNVAFSLVGTVLCCIVGWRRANRLLLQRKVEGRVGRS